MLGSLALATYRSARQVGVIITLRVPHGVFCLGVPHRLTQDDLHDGYFFPKGTVFITNIWYAYSPSSGQMLNDARSMMRDPRCYSSPEDFNPDRFLAHDNTEPEYDPRHIVFGFGRR